MPVHQWCGGNSNESDGKLFRSLSGYIGTYTLRALLRCVRKDSITRSDVSACAEFPTTKLHKIMLQSFILQALSHCVCVCCVCVCVCECVCACAVRRTLYFQFSRGCP